MRRDMYSRVRAETARDILQYFVTHPAAKDTLEGIARWWLDRERVDRTIDEVAESLRFLVACGFIMEQQGRAVRPYYQMNPAKRTEIARFLTTDNHRESAEANA